MVMSLSRHVHQCHDRCHSRVHTHRGLLDVVVELYITFSVPRRRVHHGAMICHDLFMIRALHGRAHRVMVILLVVMMMCM